MKILKSLCIMACLLIPLTVFGASGDPVIEGKTAATVTTTLLTAGKTINSSTPLSVTTEADMPNPLVTTLYIVSGDNDTDNDVIDLQNGTTAGQLLIILSGTGIDADDTITIAMTDTTCTSCPSIVFDKQGESAILIWDGSSWAVLSLNNSL
ncbi:MAG: hypothetical protein Q8O94_03300 [bacterium]|nr:hypothetical protein [bacterium]